MSHQHALDTFAALPSVLPFLQEHKDAFLPNLSIGCLLDLACSVLPFSRREVCIDFCERLVRLGASEDGLSKTSDGGFTIRDHLWLLYYACFVVDPAWPASHMYLLCLLAALCAVTGVLITADTLPAFVDARPLPFCILETLYAFYLPPVDSPNLQ